eukprot:gene28390-34441_t
MVVLRIAFLSSAVLELFSALGVAMVAAYIGFSLLGSIHFGTWGRELSLGQGLFILLLAPAFFEPLRELAAVWHDKAAGEAGLAGLHDLAADGVPLPGAGVETTLLSLLAGLLPAGGGEIRIGGVRLNDASVNTLRQRMAWMGQRPHVFAASVSQNVTLGRAGASAAQVTQALHLADLAQVAQAQPAVMLSDGGQGLSGGEAVRLALARVALHPHADLLLVDEPTAHLDSETAARVTDALLALAQGKTMLVATHDPVLAGRLQRTVQVDAPVQELQAEARLLLAQPGKLIAGAVLAALTAVAGMALLGLSGWFITATSIAGLHASTAVLFDVFGPSAGIRLLAIGRTGSRYAERLVTHDATFAALAHIRVQLFRGWSRPEAASRLLRQPAKLLFRLTADIDALESLYLRLLVPAFTALCAALLAGVALGLMQWQLGVGVAAWLLAAGGGIGWLVARRARRPAIVRSRAIEKLRSGTIDLVAGQTDLMMAGRIDAQCAVLAQIDRSLAQADVALQRLETTAGAAYGVASSVTLAGVLLAVAALAQQQALDVPLAALA